MNVAFSPLLDTNILLRRVRADDSEYALVTGALTTLRAAGESLFVVPQNIVEASAVMTRPLPGNGFGLDREAAERELQQIERLFTLLPDTPEVHHQWRLLFAEVGAAGRQVYDMRLVAAMRAHGLTHILTINGDDFRRYPGIVIVHPKDV